jgi:hypothetical protein
MLGFKYQETLVNHKYKTTFELNDSIIKKYLRSLGLDENSENIPSSIFAIYHFWNSTLGNPVPGTIHLKQKMENFLKPKNGDLYDVVITITDKYKKKGRDYLVFETEFYKDSQLYCKETTTYLWGFASGN